MYFDTEKLTKKLVFFIFITFSFSVYGNNPCFEKVIELALTNTAKSIDHVSELEKCKNVFFKEIDPLKHPQETRTWLEHLIKNNLYDEQTAQKLLQIEGMMAKEGRGPALMAKLQKPPYSLDKNEALSLADLLSEAHLRMELVKKSLWNAERIKDHVLGVTVKKNTPYMSGGGHTQNGIETFLEKTFNPAHPKSTVKIVEIPGPPKSDQFKSGDVLIETLPNGVERAYLPGKIMNKTSFGNSKMTTPNPSVFFREAIPGTSEAYKGKSLFPKSWSEQDLFEAQQQIIKNPRKVTIRLDKRGEGEKINFEGFFIKDGQSVLITIGGYEKDGKFIFQTMFPNWNQF